jgi:phosphatidylglycerophosphatase A
MLTPIGKLLITTFYLGLLRPAPGTWGSLPPPALAALLMLAGFTPGGSVVGQPSLVYHAALLGVLVVFSAACVWFGRDAEWTFGKKDPGSVCADETAGQCLPLMFLPAAASQSPVHILGVCALAFLAFRVFDILKLWPARGLQRLTGGWGILVDDLIAGVHALILVQLVTRLAL